MNQNERVIIAVILSFVIALSVVYVTEEVYQSMVFSWAIDEGDAFIFDVVVTGNRFSGNTTIPPPFAEMNNTRISVEIVSLPNVSIIFYSGPFLETVVEPTKTSSEFINGTDIPAPYRYAINTHISRCVLPVGGWRHLDSFFPNRIDRPFNEYQSYLSVHRGNSFYFGFSSNETTESHVWYGIIDLDTGVPQTVSFWIYQMGQLWTDSYNVTMSRVT